MPDHTPIGAARLQPGSILLHIGVHKTGTTAIQDALARGRADLHRWAVRYPGDEQAHRDVASSAMDRPLGWRTGGARPPDPRLWDTFVTEAQAFNGVTVCSSEFFAESPDEVAQRIIDRIGVERVHVVVTLRNLGMILPSAWQQILKSGYESGYEHWLRNVLTSTDLEPKAQVFWTRHRHDEVVGRWSRIVGSDHMTVVVVDDSDRESIYAHFEQLLGLPAGALLEYRNQHPNRSMTLAEAEFLRRLNLAVGGGRGWRPYSDAVHDGLIKGMVEGRTPAPDEPRLRTPQWALDRAAELADGYVEAIRASGVQVLGDLELLRAHLTGPASLDDEDLPSMQIDAAVAAMLGALAGSTPKPDPTIPGLVRKRLGRIKARALRRSS